MTCFARGKVNLVLPGGGSPSSAVKPPTTIEEYNEAMSERDPSLVIEFLYIKQQDAKYRDRWTVLQPVAFLNDTSLKLKIL